ncbi:Dihydrolipoyllysine-residue acetyltransferase component of acetoin cleaving system [Falsiruegeria litorea R37]|uniref:Dihydrolipoyllysine-residue acetyltransferase component of acetoin cleaving system n=1 Tax=Falsiruegeria litorea R37 TaxID=1200284 RepID=A0A1Y5TS76_9RHOB|nr:alpha/beta hydrolase [Falsiruegeria litorea]SLN71106.1 Dihydrolipoyllysine-residue acetyltransferase component of acetoin cleaving system [Falsiruegeria litorea R37]
MTLTTLQLSEPYGQIAYREAGQGEPVVLIHGVGMQSAAWGPQVDALSATHHVIAVDMPGHGGSDPLPEASELPDFVAWTSAVLIALNLGPVNLAGHSMGALIAGGMAIEHPDQVKRVAVVNGVYRRSADARQAVEARADEICNGPVDLQTPLNRWFGPQEMAARDQVANWLRQVDQGGYATAYSAFARGDDTYADGWPKVACPMLALTGDGDPNSTPEMSQAMADAAQDGEAVIIEDHRHMVNLTAPDVVTDILQTWLARPATKGSPE